MSADRRLRSSRKLASSPGCRSNAVNSPSALNVRVSFAGLWGWISELSDNGYLGNDPYGQVGYKDCRKCRKVSKRKYEIHDNRINLDTGAFATGRLTCAVFEDNEVSFL